MEIATQPTNRNNLLTKVLTNTLQQVRKSSDQAQIEGTYENLIMHVMHTAIVVRNEYVIDMILKSIDDIRKDKNLYRHEVKKYLRLTEKYKSDYCELTEKFVYNDELLDYLDDITAKYKEHLNNVALRFYYAIKQEMDNQNVEDSHFYANMEMSMVLLETNIRIYEEEKISEYLLRDAIRGFDYLRLDDLAANWKRVCAAVYHQKFKWDVNLNSERCKMAYRDLVKGMRDYEFILSLITKKDEQD